MSNSTDYPCPHDWCAGGVGMMCTNRQGRVAAAEHRVRISQWLARNEPYTRTPNRELLPISQGLGNDSRGVAQ